MKFEFYVLNYNFNGRHVEAFNIFNNTYVQQSAERYAKKYLRSPSKYTFHRWNKEYTGFEAFCKSIESAIFSEEWSRREYEISVADAFEEDPGKFEKWDCFGQCLPNIEVIAREVLYQYKKQKKEGKEEQ